MLHPNRLSLPCRKAHLLEDKQIPSVGVFDEVSFYTLFQALGWHLEEIHATWTQFGKKWTKSQLYTEFEVKRPYRVWRRVKETTSGFLVMALEVAD
ncbi:hypothetical protein Tco_1408446 [Tanacetum coccineum]